MLKIHSMQWIVVLDQTKNSKPYNIPLSLMLNFTNGSWQSETNCNIQNQPSATSWNASWIRNTHSLIFQCHWVPWKIAPPSKPFSLLSPCYLLTWCLPSVATLAFQPQLLVLSPGPQSQCCHQPAILIVKELRFQDSLTMATDVSMLANNCSA